MNQLWDVLDQLDLPNKARNAVASIDAADPRFLAALVLVLLYVGSKIVSGQPKIRALGLRLGLATFLAYGGYAYYAGADEPLGWIALRAANVGGVVLAVTWIVLPVVSFICSYFRVALAAFLGYCGYAVATAENFDPEQLPGIALRALVVVALTLIVAWILQPVWDFCKEILPRRGDEEAGRSASFQRQLRKARKQRTRLRAELASARADATPAPPVPVVEPAAARSDLVDPLELASSMLHAEAQRQRDKARLQVELIYAAAMPDIATRLPRSTLDDLLHRFLGEQVPTDDLDEHVRQLQLLVDQHRKAAQPTPELPDLEELGRWFLDEQKRIQAMVIDHHFKQTKLAALQQQYMALATQQLHTPPTS